jgi:FkbM family methyltransferase
MLLEALGYLAPQTATSLAFSAPIDPETRDRLLERAAELSIADRVHFVPDSQAAKATCVVLLGPPDGNDAIVLADAFADGVPVVTDQPPPFGAGAVWKVDVDTDAATLSTQLLALARSPEQLAQRGRAARAHAAAWEIGDVSRHVLSRAGVEDDRTRHPDEASDGSAEIGVDAGPLHVATWRRPLAAPAPPVDRGRLSALAGLIDEPIVVVDVGCRWGFADAWTDLAGAARLYGFEPDEAECARLARRYQDRPEVVVVPAALGRRRGTANLHLTREPACASLYPPGPATRRHPAMAPMRLGGVERVTLETLDDWASVAGVPRVDVLKADTQGSELDVLAGAEASLRHVRALELEVEFNPIYDDQPLFGDVDRFLRDRGFVLWRLRHLVHYGQDGTHAATRVDDVQFFDDDGVGFTARGGQLFWGMAYYVSEEVADPALVDDWRRLVRDACLLTALDIPDLAGIALSRANALAPTPELLGDLGTDTG